MVCEYSKRFISQEALDEALYEATDNEKMTTVQNLLLLGASANATGKDYGNALTAAAYDGQSEIVSILLKAGARVNSEDGWALQTAAGQGHIEVVKLLLEAGADVNACTKDERFPQGTALQAAVESSSSEIVTLLLSNKADPNLG
ncbi:ankyrin, partial [Byssothecium circinans]